MTKRLARWLGVVVVALLVASTANIERAFAVVSAAVVVDAKTGKVLYSNNATTKTYPASLTKIMTLYMLFEALDSGKVTLSSRITVSKHAASQPPSKLGLKPGQTISVKDAILSLVTRSANDIACAVGEHLAGTEAAFGAKMTERARQLGMKNTTFKNASGLPNNAQVTTAADMAILGRAVQDRFPHHFHYFKVSSFTYKGTKIGNHNKLLGKVPGVDGIKTGYIRASGFNLVTSVNTRNQRLVAVVMGGASGAKRNARMSSLIKSYLPRASRGAQIAGPILPDAGASYYAYIPTPRLRPDGSIETGSIQVAATPVSPTTAEEGLQAQGDISDDVIVEPPSAPGAIDTIPSGWKIQIAAAPTQDAAVDLLRRALDQGSTTVLASAMPYTEPVLKEEVTLYRARFGGFSDKSEARAACAYLTKHKFACYAISD